MSHEKILAEIEKIIAVDEKIVKDELFECITILSEMLGHIKEPNKIQFYDALEHALEYVEMRILIKLCAETYKNEIRRLI